MQTLKIRIKGNCKWLAKLANEVNFVWNYVNDLFFRNIQQRGKFLSAYDVDKYLVGATKEGLNLHIHTLQEIAFQYVVKRKMAKKHKLKWRSKRSLGWIPFKVGSIRLKESTLYYKNFTFKVWDS